MTRWGEALAAAKKRLEAAGIESARLDARILLSHILKIEAHHLFAYPEKELSERQEEEIERLIQRREKREPVSHILGVREFWSLPFRVSASVLDPRPDSETLIEAVLERIPDRDRAFSMVDFGTGSGCLALTLLTLFPNATAVGVDISEDALEIAQENARNLGLLERISFSHGNWDENLKNSFDLVVSNPPYIPDGEIENLADEVRRFDPALALKGGEDGLDCYRALAPIIEKRLNFNGLAAIEIGKGQEAEVSALMHRAGLRVLEIRPDLAGIGRVAIAVKDAGLSD